MTQARTLAERLFLLSLRTDGHTMRSSFSRQRGNLDLTLQAALIVELVERGRVDVASRRKPFGGEKFTLVQSGYESTGNVPLDALLDRIADSRNTGKSIPSWLTAGHAKQSIIDDLSERGVVTLHREGSGLFAKMRIEPVYPAAHDAIRDEFEGVFLRDAEPTRYDVLTAALLLNGDTWEYVEPVKGTPGIAHFFERLDELSNRHGPKWWESPEVEHDPRGVSRVLYALGRANAPSS